MELLRKNWWKILVGVLVVGILMFVSGVVKKSKPNDASIEQGHLEKTSQPVSLASCGDKNDYFVNFPLAEGDFGGITPLGSLNPTGHTFPTDHLYVWVKGEDKQEGSDNQPTTLKVGKPLLAPADMVITEVDSSEETGGVGDYGMRFAVCNELTGQFGHVGTLSQSVQTAIGKAKPQCEEYDTGGNHYRNCQYTDLNLKVSAGEQLGTVGDGRSHFLDIWTTDTRLPKIAYANPSRWRDSSFYVACFLDYFDSAQKNKHYTMLGDQELKNKRAKEPLCGTVATDVAGTAQGVWFYNLQGQMQQEDEHLALAFDNLQTDKQVFSAGTSFSQIGLDSGRYIFTPKTSGLVNRDFSQVAPDGNVYCYETQNDRNNNQKAALLLQLESDTKLKLGALGKPSCSSSKAGGWQFSSSVEYER